MKLRSLRVENQPQLMIIPMIDIIFFLLVFFMMSTLYMVEQKTIPVNLPPAAAARTDINAAANVTLTPDGRVTFNQEEVPLTLLGKRIAAEMNRQPETTFVLRADKTIEYGKIIAVRDELKLACARKISVATGQKAGQP